MMRLIDADALEKRLEETRNAYEVNGYDTKPLTIEELKCHIKEKDAEPLWVEKNYCNEASEWRLAKDIADWLKNPVCADEYNDTWRCWNSHPEERVRKDAKWGDELFNERCPNCGAKMDLEG